MAGAEGTGQSVLTVNGQPWNGPVPITAADLVASVCPSPRGIAVACDREVIPRSLWATTVFHPGQVIEVVSAAAGG
jgi:thiamine biosynthesis protein ThiS